MKSIILTGPKASGKTSAGKSLAPLYKCRFIDLDELIFQRTGKTPRQLYIDGSAVFQNAEADAVQSLASADSADAGKEPIQIVSAGGGIIDNPEAAATLKKLDAVIVYLSISADSAWNRINASVTKTGELPPFLQTDNPRETHRILHERRAAAYLQAADLSVDAEGKTPDEIASEIFKHYV